MIALDTNILVYAVRQDSSHHGKAKRPLARLAEGEEPWGLPWPCVYEFLRVVTHPRIFDPPTEIELALDDLASLFESPSLLLIGEGPGHSRYLRQAVSAGKAVGNMAHDAHIAALVLEHGARELWTTDKDFNRFPGLRVRDPFAERALHEPRPGYSGSSRKRKKWTTGRSRKQRPSLRSR